MTSDKPDSPSAKQVLSDYLDDMLGAVSESPLQAKLEEEAKPDASISKPETRTSDKESSASAIKDSFNLPLSSSVPEPPSTVPRSSSRSMSTAPKNFAEPEKKVLQVSLAEEKVLTAAMPTFAPPKLKEDVAPKVKVDAPEVKESVQPKVEVQPLQEATPAALGAEPAQPNSTSKPSAGEVLEPEEWAENGRPLWAQGRFECLLFTVAGLKLAVPLVSLGSIHRIEEEFTPLVGRAEWFLGLYRAGERNIQAVDTAKWVMPKHYREDILQGYHFLIRLGDGNWGMACDSVEQAIQLEPEQVKWRTERSKRAWLSGTVIDHMCALLDADMLAYLLQQDAKKRRA